LNIYFIVYLTLLRHKIATISAHAKKRKVDAECRVVNQIWTDKYLLTEIRGEAVCLVSGEQIAEYNLNRHHNKKHVGTYKSLTDAERARTSEALLAKLQRQHCCFTKLHSGAATKTSFVISHKIAKNSKAFSKGEFIRVLGGLCVANIPRKKKKHLRKPRCPGEL